MINIKYFASLRESLGKQQDQIPCPSPCTVEQAWTQANPDTAPPEHILVAINQEYASLDAALKSGDEVAFFPPVTGG